MVAYQPDGIRFRGQPVEPSLVRLDSSSGHGEQANCTSSLLKICGPRTRLG